MSLFKDNGAAFSECRRYRYALWRIWDKAKPMVMFIGLNPSTANESQDDPTIKRVCAIANHNGYGGVYMMNCFPLVSTNPSTMIEFYETSFHEVEDIENMRWILNISKQCKQIVFAWGNFEVAKERAASLNGYFKNAMALQINKNGSPKHPLYCRVDTKLIQYNKILNQCHT